MKGPRILRVAVLASCLAAALPALGQDAETADDSDVGSWTAAELKYKVHRRWTLAGEGELRLKNDLAEVDRYFGQFEVEFRPLTDVALDGGIRFTRRNDTEGKVQGYESRRRHYVSGSYGPDLGRFSLGFRMRYQTEGDVTEAGYQETDRHLRFRARVRYDIRKWAFDPDVAAELWRPVGGDGHSGFDNLRLILGTDWEAWSRGDIGIFYLYERELGAEPRRTTHVIGMKVSSTFGKD